MSQRCHIVVAIAVMLVAAMICAQPARANAETTKENGADNEPASADPCDLKVVYAAPEEYPAEMPELRYVRALYKVTTEGECPPDPNRTWTLTLSFAGEEVTELGIDYLAIFHYDPATETWSDLPSTVDKDNLTVTATISELGIYTISGTATGDQEPPTVRWLLPREGETVTGETKLVVIPEDNVGVLMVEFCLNDWRIASDMSAMDGGWGAEVDFSGYVSGTYTLKAVAHDLAGNVGEATRQVVLQTAAAAPQVTIGTPQYVDPRTVEVSGTMSDADGEVLGMFLEMDGQPAGNEMQMNGNQWSCTLTDCEFGPGQHTLVIHAVDNYGNQSTATTAASLPLASACLLTEPYWPQLENTPITLTAGATGGTENVLYKFTVNGNTLRDYEPSNTCVWTPDAPDTYTLKVFVREPEQGEPEAVSCEEEYVIASPLSRVTLAVDPASPQPANTEISLTATPTGGANVDYNFEAWDVERQQWVSLSQGYYWDNACLWVPTQPGEYHLKVSARLMGGTEVFTDSKSYFIE